MLQRETVWKSRGPGDDYIYQVLINTQGFSLSWRAFVTFYKGGRIKRNRSNGEPGLNVDYRQASLFSCSWPRHLSLAVTTSN